MADMYLGNESGGFDLVGTTNIKNIDFEEAKISKEDYENLSEEERKTGIHLVTGLDDTENGGGSADLISYDNTNSGLGSTNVQGAIDELNKKLDWKLVGTVGVRVDMALPTSFTELLIEISKSGYYNHTFHVLADMVSTNEKDFGCGYRFTTNTNAGAQVRVSLTNIRLADCYFNGSIANDANMTVYYR